MKFPAVIAIVVFALMPIFGPLTAVMHGMGLLVLPYLAGRWVYERFHGPWWLLAALPIPFIWYYGWISAIIGRTNWLF